MAGDEPRDLGRAGPDPDPADFSTVADFGEAVTELRLRRGLSIRESARRCGLPVSTVGGYFSGRHLPPTTRPQVLDALLVVLGVDDAARPAWHRAARRLARGRAAPERREPSPYPGLRAYDTSDARHFHGRGALTDHLADAVRAAGTGDGPRVVVTVGGSGAGKSSLIRAGVLPRLGGWSTALTTPGHNALESLSTVTAGLAGAGPSVLVLDQFEELWTRTPDHSTRQRFIKSAIDWTTAAEQRVLLISIRADFYGEAASVPELRDPLERHQVVVGPMSVTELSEVVFEPANAAGLPVEAGLAELIIEDCTGATERVRPGVLPHLSHCLAALWATAGPAGLTLRDYLACGRLTGAINETAEQVWDELPQADRAGARSLLLQLVTVDHDLPPISRVVALSGLPPDQRRLVDRFAASRLVTTDRDSVRLSHEALISSWPRLAAWIEENEQSLLLRRTVAREATAWAVADRDPDLLLRGSRLETVREWSPEQAGELTDLEQAYLSESRALEDRNRGLGRRRRRRLQLFAGVLAVVTALALTATAGYVRTAMSLTRERDDARSRQLAVTSQTVEESDHVVGQLLALAGQEVSDTLEARSAVVSASAGPTVSRIVGGRGLRRLASQPGEGLLVVAGNASTAQLYDVRGAQPQLLGAVRAPVDGSRDSTIFAATLSEDGTTLALGGDAGRVQLYDVHDPAAPKETGPALEVGGTVYGLVFVGNQLLAGSSEGEVRGWRLSSAGPEPLAALSTGSAVTAMTVSGTGQVAAATAGGDVFTWKPGTGPSAATPHRAHVADREIDTLAFDPDGALLAGGRDGVLRRVAAKDGRPGGQTAIASFKSWVNAVVDTSTLRAAGSSDTTVRVWRGAEDAGGTTMGFPSVVTALAPVGPSKLAVGMGDGSVQLVDLDKTMLFPGTGGVFTTAIDSAGERLAVLAGSVNQLDVYDVSNPWTPSLLGSVVGKHADNPYNGAGALSPDGRLLVGAALDGTVVGTDITDPVRPRTAFELKVGKAMVQSVAISADGTTMVAGGDDSLVHVVDLTTESPTVSADLEGPENHVLGVAISPDGSVLAAASLDGTVRLWTSDGGRWVARSTVRHEGQAYAVDFAPNGRLLASSGTDDVVHVWSLEDLGHPREVATLTGPQGDVYSVKWSEAGDVAASSLDRSVTVWRPAPDSGARWSTYLVLRDRESSFYSVGWGHAGHLLVGGGSAGLVRLWNTEPASVGEHVCTHVGTPLTRSEWKLLAGSLPYGQPCRPQRTSG